ncbi:GGDEF domain-containing protein [Enterovibrio norvegicus]|uniref:diguanylate cyclase n=2 Tax=Enterovibrio norvegicus TaxID=188144 RepID=A0A1I5UAJ9_9GAMM|nr:GGDEF domain-containing protein [Enterovibrio norvegicus]OEF59470.1 diguanylate cyclase [Enterovibrio norvegicus]SFP92319.1 diguanylate cyclase (GGDEF) domain-containing protein [Enterovibrio norvegicus DSM 15893]
MTVTSIDVLDSVVDITAQTESDTISESLITTILQLTPANQVLVLDYNPDTNPDFMVVACSDIFLFEEEKDAIERVLRSCVAIGDNVVEYSKTDNQSLLAVPIRFGEKDDIHAVVFCKCDQVKGDEVQLIEGLAKIYENYQKIISASERDGLTGLYNRKVLTTKIDLLLDRFLIQGSSITDDPTHHHWVCIFDIDHFKQINDTLGHVFGDEVILLITAMMKQNFDDEDILFRYGGDEFVAIMHPQSREDMEATVRNFFDAVNNRDYGQAKNVSISMGAASINDQELNAITVLGFADQSLYKAKQNGRNQVAFYEDLIASGELKSLVPEDDVELF